MPSTRKIMPFHDSGPTRVGPCGVSQDWGLAKMNELRVADGNLRTCCGELMINRECHFANSPAHLETTEASLSTFAIGACHKARPSRPWPLWRPTPLMKSEIRGSKSRGLRLTWGTLSMRMTVIPRKLQLAPAALAKAPPSVPTQSSFQI